MRISQWASQLLQRIHARPPLHFLHIGKTGGTAVRHALAPHPSTPRFVLHLHPHEVTLQSVPPGEGVVFFLRDPVSRFASAFLSRFRQGQPRYLSPWNDDEREVFEHFRTPNQLAVALTAVDPKLCERARKAMRTIRVVKDSYRTWLGDEAYLRERWADVFFVGFQETLTEDFEALKAKLGLRLDIRLPSDDVQAHRTPAHLDRNLTDEAVRNLTDWYREDYDFIRLCRDLLRQDRAA